MESDLSRQQLMNVLYSQASCSVCGGAGTISMHITRPRIPCPHCRLEAIKETARLTAVAEECAERATMWGMS